MLGPTRLLGAAIVMLALLGVWVETAAVPVPVSDLAANEGRRVVVTGRVEPTDGGAGRLVDDGHAVRILAEAPLDPGPAEVVGRVVRLDGRLTLIVDDITWTS